MSNHRRLHCLTCEEAGIGDPDGYGYDTQVNHGLAIFQKIAKHLDHFRVLNNAFDISFQVNEAMGYGAERAVVYLLEYHPQPDHHVVIRSEYYRGDETTSPDYLDQPLTGPIADTNLLLAEVMVATPYPNDAWEGLRNHMERTLKAGFITADELKPLAMSNHPSVVSYFMTLLLRHSGVRSDQVAVFLEQVTSWDRDQGNGDFQ